MKSRVGFSSQSGKQPTDFCWEEIDMTEEKNLYVTLIWDEMKVNEDLVFDKHNCEHGWFSCVDCGNHINHLLDTLQQQCNSPDHGCRR